MKYVMQMVSTVFVASALWGCGEVTAEQRPQKSAEKKNDPVGKVSKEVEQKEEVPSAKIPTAFDSKPVVGTKAFCPVMKHEFVVSESTEHSLHRGKHYAFCCPGCKPQFDAEPGKFLAP